MTIVSDIMFVEQWRILCLEFNWQSVTDVKNTRMIEMIQPEYSIVRVQNEVEFGVSAQQIIGYFYSFQKVDKLVQIPVCFK